MALVRIPKVFYDDHTSGRELPAPPVAVDGTRHYWIDANHADASELLEDAEFYADPAGPIAGNNAEPSYLGLASSARATVRALRNAGVRVAS
jgi:hypothetical protein